MDGLTAKRVFIALDGPRQETSHPLGCDTNCLEFSMKYM